MVNFGTKIVVLGVILVASIEIIYFDIKVKDYTHLVIDAVTCGSCLFSLAYLFLVGLMSVWFASDIKQKVGLSR